MTPTVLHVRALALELCARALAGEAGRTTRETVLAQKRLSLAPFGRKLGYYAGAAWMEAALQGEGVPISDIRASGVLRRDVEDALVLAWPDAQGHPAGLIYRRNTALVTANPFGSTEIRYALTGERDQLPLDGAIAARAAGHDRLVVVEGTTDYLVLAQAGVTDVATPHTCAVRPPQLLHLRRLGFKGLTLCFDPDFAGWRGMLSAIEGAFACGLSVSVASPEREGEDVDELVNRAGVPAFRARLARATDGLDAYARAILIAAEGAPDPTETIADLSARFAILAPDASASALLDAAFWPRIDAEIGAARRYDQLARAIEAAQGRRLQVSPIGSLLKNRSGSLRQWTGS